MHRSGMNFASFLENPITIRLMPAVAIVLIAFLLPMGLLAYENQTPELGVHDEAGVLNEAERDLIDEHIEMVESAGAPTVVYLRLKDAGVDETIADARDLMNLWDVQSEPDVRDGVVMFLNLDTEDPEHGSLAIVAGQSHVEPGTLSESRLDAIRDEMIVLLTDGEMAEGIILGLDRIADRLEEGPPEPTVLQTWISNTSNGLFSPLNGMAMLTAIAIAFISWQAWSARPRLHNVREIPTTRLPGDLHPAYAGALSSGKVSDTQIEATVLELARRGALVIEPEPDSDNKARIRLLDDSLAENDLERELLTLLRSQSSNGIIGHNSLRKTRGTWGDLRRLLQRELEERGWFEPRANHLRLPFIVSGSIGVLLAITVLAASVYAQEPWPLAGAAITGIVGAVALSMASILPSTTREGERQAIPWRGYRTGLSNSRDRAYGEINLDEAFPYIVAMSIAVKFQRHLRKANEAGYVPTWLGQRDEIDHFAGNWYVCWIAAHKAMAPTDASTTSTPGGAATGSGATGGRF